MVRTMEIPILSPAETPVAPNNGADITSARIRKNGQKNSAIHAYICVEETLNMVLSQKEIDQPIMVGMPVNRRVI